MGREILKAGGVVLPAPVSITVNDEIIWSADTGRTMSGQMVGEAVAEKKNVGIKWGCLIEGDMMQIRLEDIWCLVFFQSVSGMTGLCWP